MKKITKILSITAFLAAATAANAKIDFVELEDNSKILGKWHVYAAAPSEKKEKRAQDSVWNFQRNGVLNISGKDQVSGRTGQMSVNIKYMIENGQIKRQKAPGREKYELCGVVRMSDKEMTVKCPFLFYYMKKM